MPKVRDIRLLAAFTVAYQSGKVIGAMDLALWADAMLAVCVCVLFVWCLSGSDE